MDEDAPDVGDLLDELEALEAHLDDPQALEHVENAMETATDLQQNASIFGRVIRGYDRNDVAETLIGSLLLGIPMAVESGTLEAGSFVATHPFYLATMLVSTTALVVSVLYVADFQDVRVANPIFGFIPRRLLGVLTISYGTAIALLTGWGMVDWTDPWLAICVSSVAFVPMSIGAALGDILPGS